MRWGRFVFLAHMAIVSVLWIHHVFSKEEKKKQIVVRTIRASSELKIAKAPQSSPKPSPKKGVAPVVKATPQPKEVKKKAASIAVKKENDTLLQEIAKDLALLEEKKPSIASSAPLMIPSLEMPDEAPEIVAKEAPYGELLIAYLEKALSLPYRGDVQVELEVNAQGEVIRCDILSMENEENSAFLKKQLPALHLPCFNGRSNETFICTVVFKNK